MPLNSQLLTVNCELPMTSNERKAALEAIIYAADEPATIDQLATALGEDKIAVQNSLDELLASYASDERGIEIRAVAPPRPPPLPPPPPPPPPPSTLSPPPPSRHSSVLHYYLDLI